MAVGGAGRSSLRGSTGRSARATSVAFRRRVGLLLAQSLGVASPLVGELEEQGAACGVVRRFGGPSAFLRVLLVEASERHGSPSIQVRGSPTPAPQVTLLVCRGAAQRGSVLGGRLLSVLDNR